MLPVSDRFRRRSRRSIPSPVTAFVRPKCGCPIPGPWIERTSAICAENLGGAKLMLSELNQTACGGSDRLPGRGSCKDRQDAGAGRTSCRQAALPVLIHTIHGQKKREKRLKKQNPDGRFLRMDRLKMWLEAATSKVILARSRAVHLE